MTRSSDISAGRTYVKPPLRSCLTCEASFRSVSEFGEVSPFGKITFQESGSPYRWALTSVPTSGIG